MAGVICAPPTSSVIFTLCILGSLGVLGPTTSYTLAQATQPGLIKPCAVVWDPHLETLGNYTRHAQVFLSHCRVGKRVSQLCPRGGGLQGLEGCHRQPAILLVLVSSAAALTSSRTSCLHLFAWALLYYGEGKHPKPAIPLATAPPNALCLRLASAVASSTSYRSELQNQQLRFWDPSSLCTAAPI